LFYVPDYQVLNSAGVTSSLIGLLNTCITSTEEQGDITLDCNHDN
jgi:hypothetical protein